MNEEKGLQKDGFQKRGKFWSYRMRVPDPVTGKKKEVRVSGFLTKAEAKADRVVKETLASEGRYLKPTKLTVEEHFEEWLDLRIKTKNVKASTIAQHRYLLDKYILPKFGSKALKDLSPELIEKTLLDLAVSGKRDGSALSKSSIRLIALTLSQGLDRAVKNRKILTNPMSAVEIPKGSTKKVGSYSAQEVKRLLEQAKSHRLYALLFLACHTGARRGELCALLWSDFDSQKGTISITKTRGMSNGVIINEPSTKSRKGMRKVVLDEESVQVLKAHKDLLALEEIRYGDGWISSGHIFVREDGEPIYPTSAYSIFRTIAKRAGLSPEPFHLLRHTHATELLRAGMPPYQVAQRLGDEVATVLNTYAHAKPEDDQVLADSFAEMIRNA